MTFLNIQDFPTDILMLSHKHHLYYTIQTMRRSRRIKIAFTADQIALVI